MNSITTTWEHDDWVRQLLAVLPPARPEASGGPVARPNSIWVSKATRRRCAVLWATTTKVCVRYADDDIRARRTFDTEAFMRLYTPV